MERFVTADLQVSVSEAELLRVIKIEEDPADEDYQRVSSMLREALSCARPKYVYKLAEIDEKGEDYIVAEGRKFASALVRQNVDAVLRIFPYAATCGVEVDAWSRQFDDILEQYWADEIKNQILYKAVTHLRQTVKERYFPGMDMSQMSPGSLPAWPVTEQRALFDLIGDVKNDIGVTLTDSYLMIPSKSVSGFYFSSTHHFENCRLCPRKNCPGRRVPYQPDAHEAVMH